MTEIIEKERPDALLPNLGGQSGLNLALGAGARRACSSKYGVKVIGVQRRRHRARRGPPGLQGHDEPARHRHAAERARLLASRRRRRSRRELGYPVVIRPAYTMGGTGGGLVYNVEELRDRRAARPLGQPDRPDPRRGVGARLGGAGAGGRPRREEPDDHRLLHREHRRDGRAHRRLVLHRADADDRRRSCRSGCRSTRTTSSRRSRSSAARTSSSPTTRRPAAWWSSRSTRAPRAPRRWPRRRRASRSRSVSSQLAGGPDARRDPVLARRHAGEVHAVGRLRGGQVLALGVREVPAAPRTSSARRCGPSAR